MYEVQTYQENQWVNKWSTADERGIPRPCRFSTYKQALNHLCDYLEKKHGNGWFTSVSSYNPHDYRIMEID